MMDPRLTRVVFTSIGVVPRAATTGVPSARVAAFSFVRVSLRVFAPVGPARRGRHTLDVGGSNACTNPAHIHPFHLLQRVVVVVVVVRTYLEHGLQSVWKTSRHVYRLFVVVVVVVVVVVRVLVCRRMSD